MWLVRSVEKYTVRTEAMVCPKCGFQVLTDAQSAAYTIAIADAYRTTHGLLTTEDLKAARGRLRMSQRDFAKFLRVGEASVKRWEAGLFQDEANDQLIRLRTDLEAARRNVSELEQRTEPFVTAGIRRLLFPYRASLRAVLNGPALSTSKACPYRFLSMRDYCASA